MYSAYYHGLVVGGAKGPWCGCERPQPSGCLAVRSVCPVHRPVGIVKRNCERPHFKIRTRAKIQFYTDPVDCDAGTR